MQELLDNADDTRRDIDPPCLKAVQHCTVQHDDRQASDATPTVRQGTCMFQVNLLRTLMEDGRENV